MSDTAMTIIGNVARPPEGRITPKGSHVLVVTVASSRSKRTDDGWEQTDTSYFDVELWDSLAKNANNTLRKGMGVIVHGHVRTDTWEEDGNKRYRQKIVAKAIGPNLRWQKAAVERVSEGRPFDGAPVEWAKPTPKNELPETDIHADVKEAAVDVSDVEPGAAGSSDSRPNERELVGAGLNTSGNAPF